MPLSPPVATLASGLQLQLNAQSGDYSLYVSGSPWLRGAPTFFTVGGHEYNTAAGGGLALLGSYSDSGLDSLGDWSSVVIMYRAGGNASGGGVGVSIEFKEYAGLPGVVFFGQVRLRVVTRCSVAVASVSAL